MREVKFSLQEYANIHTKGWGGHTLQGLLCSNYTAESWACRKEPIYRV